MAKAHIRQRILGAAVVLSIGFIAYSILIQTSSMSYIDRSEQIPLQTRFIEPLDFEEPREPAASFEAAVPEEMFVAETAVEVAEIQSAPVLDEEGLPNSWAIKVGSFSTEARSEEIRDQLLDSGYRAYVRGISGPNEELLFRVTVGPYIDSAEVARHQTEIDELLGIETLVVDYQP